MKKFELISAVAKKTKVSQKEVEQVIDALTETIVTEVRDNSDTVSLPGLGMFKPKVNPARTGRNPLTGDSLQIPESHTLKFSASSSLKVVIPTKGAKKK